VPGVVRSIVVDTAFFLGNFPQACSADGCCVAGYPSSEELTGSCGWREIMPRAPLTGSARHAFNDQNYYSPPRNVISPGLSRVMHEGWETRRRRKPGYEWLVIRLAGQGVIELAEIDTSWFRGNQPDLVSLQALDITADESPSDESAWHDLLPRVKLLPDTPHRFRVTGAPATHVRLNLFPDGGVARLRLYGSLTGDGLTALQRRWEETT
jgi:allantoicase